MRKQVSLFLHQIICSLRVFSARDVGRILYSHGYYSNPHSAQVQAQKELNLRVALGQIEKHLSFYRVKGCLANYAEHAAALTEALVKLLSLKLPITLHREIIIPEIAHRFDAIGCITSRNRGLCFILEVANHESEDYLRSKLNSWSHWDGALSKLSSLSGYRVPTFVFVAEAPYEIPGIIPFNLFMEELHRENNRLKEP